MRKKKIRGYLLRVPSKSYRSVIIVFKDNVPQLSVGYVLYYMPFYGEEPTPLVNLPEVHIFVKIYLPNHLS